MDFYRARSRRARKDDGDDARSVRQPTNLTHEQAARILEQGEIVACEPLPWGSNYSFAAVLSLAGEPDVIGIYKPRRGEVPLWDFPDGTLYKREYAAYLLSQALGWPFIPATAVREDGPHGVGSIQLYVEPDEGGDYHGLRGNHGNELLQMALFDVIANNADRKAGHCFRGRDGKLWGIDHGLTFHPHPKLRTVIWDFCGKPIPAHMQEAMQELATDPERRADLERRLAPWIDEDELTVTMRRLDRLAAVDRFPGLDPRRNVPRGWW